MTLERAHLVWVAALLAAGCGGPPARVALDLVREATAARWEVGGASATLTPVLAVHRRGDGASRDPPRVFESRVFLDGPLPAGAGLELLVEVSRPGGLEATVALERQAPTAVSLPPGAHWLAAPGGGPGPRTVVVRSEEGPGVEVRGAGLVPAGGATSTRAGRRAPVPVLEQGPGSAARFAFLLPARAELRFTPALPEAARGPVRFRATLATEGGAERELWTGTVDAARAASLEAAVALDGRHGTPVVLGLHVEGGGGAWLAPRVMAPGPLPSLRVAASSPAGEARGRSLRQGLADANVLVVVLDAASALHFGCYGYGRATTPEIDRLAREGVVLEQAYAPAPFTVASVSSLWTSLYPDQHHHGVRHDAALPGGPSTLAEVLSARGFATAGFVANPSAGPPFGLDRGFGELHELYRAGRDRGGMSLPRAEQFRPVLGEWLRRVRGRRFFGYVHYLEPHFPYDPPPPFDRLFGPEGPLPPSARREPAWQKAVNAGSIRPSAEEREHLVRLYDGNLAAADREVGWLRSTLDELGLLERTVLVITADHGEDVLERGLSGHGALVHEESLRVPLVVRLPAGRGPAGVRRSGFVDLLDVAPTVADIFGLPGSSPAVQGFEGRSLLSLLAGGPGKAAVLGRTMQERPTYSLRHGPWTLLHSVRSGHTALFDRSRDPGEREDLAARLPVRRELMRQELMRWLRDLKRPAGAPAGRALTPEERALLRSLGYL